MLYSCCGAHMLRRRGLLWTRKNITFSSQCILHLSLPIEGFLDASIFLNVMISSRKLERSPLIGPIFLKRLHGCVYPPCTDPCAKLNLPVLASQCWICCMTSNMILKSLLFDRQIPEYSVSNINFVFSCETILLLLLYFSCDKNSFIV